jgi:hypothetical protein
MNLLYEAKYRDKYLLDVDKFEGIEHRTEDGEFSDSTEQ